jgi:regulation of enolase protein 1 (concanavalin A-like superfamily)
VNLDLHTLEELHAPVTAHVSDGLVELVAGPRTDNFCPPDRKAPTLNAPALLADLDDQDFTLSAHIEAELTDLFDAGALLVWQGDRSWAKLAVERSPEGQPTVVTVVTRDLSDDCNSVTLDQPSAHLRVARIDDAFAFHLQVAGRWQLIRHFSLDTANVRVGFSAQSPTGQGCTARFRQIRAELRRLNDVRDGT